ncbi:hypothetical protein chiPu_0016981 [Chiloscyllium punctatum]|uniref:Uncharacterized protein n=1 Tax=Chiloscyllium punctatum TaxID=137246 RepID=A0A401T779_CHIPU|nr:hypothetical protein [Chiloscyllium punctatum]
MLALAVTPKAPAGRNEALDIWTVNLLLASCGFCRVTCSSFRRHQREVQVVLVRSGTEEAWRPAWRRAHSSVLEESSSGSGQRVRRRRRRRRRIGFGR